MQQCITRVASWASSTSGVLVSLASVLLYLGGGWIVGFSEDYNLVASMFMSIVSYLLLFIVLHATDQAEQKDRLNERAMQLKLDEMLRAIRRADNRIIKIEDLSEEQIGALEEQFRDRSTRPPLEPGPAGDQHD